MGYREMVSVTAFECDYGLANRGCLEWQVPLFDGSVHGFFGHHSTGLDTQ
jgi:hypothetical protein